jgi:hypothetical protein
MWLGAVLLIPSGAHLLEMPHKLMMDHAAYFHTGKWDVGRIYQTRGGPDHLRWFWPMTVTAR